jgi:hypothetical protein
MPDQLERLEMEYDRSDQQTKREIGRHIYDKPGRWITKEEIVGNFDIDESGVSRHLDHLHDNEFIVSKKENGERLVQWNGRGSGGIEYWLRQLIPSQIQAATNELRPLLTLDSLGGAYIPTLVFGLLTVLGFLMGLLSVLIAFHPSESVFGFTTTSGVILTGFVTILASVILVTIPFARMLEVAIWRTWDQASSTEKDER